MKQYEGYKYIDGGVCAARGYRANGINCGLNPNKSKADLCLVVCDTDCTAAAVYTQNKVKGAPITVTRANLEKTKGHSRTIIANSKNANTCNADGEEKARLMCELAARETGVKPEEVIVASTGVIGQVLPIEPIEANIARLASGLTYDGNGKAAEAIMTTDTVKKEAAVEFMLGSNVCRLGAMAKGSGMIHPNMATTLNFVTTDAAVSPKMLQRALSEVTRVTYNCLSVDGDTSTNDMLCILADGLAGNEEIVSEGTDFDTFKHALYIVLSEITKMLAKDGEGATKLLECTCSSAPNQDTAIIVAKSVIGSSLLKCAMFGEDANWGRVLCAIGYADADFDIDKVGVVLASEYGEVEVCREGAGVPFSEEEAARILSADEIFINVSLNQGEGEAKAWGCDLTYDYVKINGDYRS